LKKEYLELTRLVERLHRRYLDVLRTELNRMGVRDMNAVQALLLSNIGGEEIVIRDLVERGYYQGSNVSYNIKKLTDMGYLEQERLAHDKRSVSVSLTEKAKGVVEKIHAMEEKNAVAFSDHGVDVDGVEQVAATLRFLERTWADYIHYGND
jgi:DNA-binding MarR family transcriptional regulator